MILDELKEKGREEHGFLNLGSSHVTMVYGHIQMDTSLGKGNKRKTA